MTQPGPCAACGHEDFPHPPCRCPARGCWCPVSGVEPFDLELPAAGVTPVDLDAEEGSA